MWLLENLHFLCAYVYVCVHVCAPVYIRVFGTVYACASVCVCGGVGDNVVLEMPKPFTG